MAITSIRRSFDFPVENLQDIEQTLSQSVAQAVRLLLSPELVRQSQAHGADSDEAYGYFMRARKYGHEGTPDGDDQAAGAVSARDRTRSAIRARVRRTRRDQLGTISSRELQIADVADEVTQLLATPKS